MLGYHDFLDGLTRGVAAHHAGMLPAFKECVEELFAARPVQGRLRHRDAGAGHQHAGPHRGDREAVEVERRDPRRHHAGGVHPAHRPRRPPRHRRRGPRRRAVAAGHRTPSEVAGLASTRTYPLRSSFRPSYNMAVNLVHQFGRRARARAARVVVRAVPGRQGRGRAGPAAAQEPRRRSTGTPRRRPATSATSWSTPRCGAGSPTPRRAPARARRADRREEVDRRRWSSCGPAT